MAAPSFWVTNQSHPQNPSLLGKDVADQSEEEGCHPPPLYFARWPFHRCQKLHLGTLLQHPLGTLVSLGSFVGAGSLGSRCLAPDSFRHHPVRILAHNLEFRLEPALQMCQHVLRTKTLDWPRRSEKGRAEMAGSLESNLGWNAAHHIDPPFISKTGNLVLPFLRKHLDTSVGFGHISFEQNPLFLVEGHCQVPGTMFPETLCWNTFFPSGFASENIGKVVLAFLSWSKGGSFEMKFKSLVIYPQKRQFQNV